MVASMAVRAERISQTFINKKDNQCLVFCGINHPPVRRPKFMSSGMGVGSCYLNRIQELSFQK
jgi:hypothetical protein